jgi:PAS domain S-box-containing protein
MAAGLKQDQMSQHRNTHAVQTLVQRTSEVTYAYDLEGKFTFLNEEGERLSGYSCEEACRMNIAELLDPEIAAQVSEQALRSANERVGTVYEIDIITKDGRRVPLEVSTRIVLSKGQPIEVQGIAVPTVIRSQPPQPMRQRCLDEEFFFERLSRLHSVFPKGF